MREYRYGMRLRPFAIGCEPVKGYVRFEEGTKKYHNILVYDRPLTEKEINDYELDDLNDKIYPPKEGYYQKFLYNGEVSYNFYDENGELIAENVKVERR